MSIRKGKIKDIPQIAKLSYCLVQSHAKFDDYYTMKRDAIKTFNKFHRENIYGKNSLLLVAEEKGKIIGYIVARIMKRPPIFKEKEKGFIGSVYIIKKFRRTGILKGFLDEIITWFKKKKIEHIELHIHYKNPIGINAWSKYGFRDYLQNRIKKI